MTNTGRRQVSRPSGQGSQPSQGRTNEEEEDMPTPLVEIPRRSNDTGGGGEEEKEREKTRNIMLIIKLHPFLLPGTYFSVLIIHILFQ